MPFAPVSAFARLFCLLGLLLLLTSTTFAEPKYVGSESCAGCHQAEFAAWQSSHHRQAMMHTSSESVVADFNDAEYQYNGITSRFFIENDIYKVRTDGAEGSLQTFEIKYTFGIYPLQQFLIELDGGRLQALSIVWDSRPSQEGGQRWYHLYEDDQQSIDFKDPLHWTRSQQNWNFMCAECHVTDFKKNYQLKSQTFKSDWQELGVGCESCHGPGAAHLELVQSESDSGGEGLSGFPVSLRQSLSFGFTSGVPSAVPDKVFDLNTVSQLDTCGRCHARRSPIHADYQHGQNFSEHFRLQLPVTPVYYVDGQVREEDYVLGSFLQSTMHMKGVQCSNCHEPHSGQLLQQGNGLCAQCHQSTEFDTPAHHHHPVNSDGALCVSCHMPETIYMGVDARADHSFSKPRPDLSIDMGVPNACNRCHTDQDNQWSLTSMQQWYGKDWQQPALAKAMQQHDTLILRAAIGDPEVAPIMRAAAAMNIVGYASPEDLPAIESALAANEVLVRQGALEVLSSLPPQLRVDLGWHLLTDPIRVIRLAATRAMFEVPRASLTTAQAAQLEKAMWEYGWSQWVNADRPESHMNLGLMHIAREDYVESEKAYLKALETDPQYLQAYINLADLKRIQGDESSALEYLEQALTIDPTQADAHYAKGMSLVRQSKAELAGESLRQAAVYGENPRYSYVYAVSLFDQQRTEECMDYLARSIKRFPDGFDLAYVQVLYALQLHQYALAQAGFDALQVNFPERQELEMLAQRFE